MKVRILKDIKGTGMNEHEGEVLAHAGDLLDLPVSAGASFSRSVLTSDEPTLVVKLKYGGRYSELLYEHADFESEEVR